MLTIMKKYDIYNIRNKLITLYLLNVTDIIFTLILLKTEIFNEVNPIMVKILNNSILTTMIKILLPGILLLYLYKRMRNATNNQLKLSNIALNIIVIIYALINFFHIVWLVSLPIIFNY